MTIQRFLKSVAKTLPPFKAIFEERDQLRLRLAGADPRIGDHTSYAALNRHKLDIIDFAFALATPDSFADLGGLWGVNGGYTLYALDVHKPKRASLIDTHPTKTFLQRQKGYPQLKYIKGNFGDRGIAEDVGQVDALFLFDVLLHQVSPNWDEVLEMYSRQTCCLVIFNQQWIGSDSTIRLLELGEDEYFQTVPHDRSSPPYDNLFQKLDEKHPDHDRTWRDVHHIWQWGITDMDLQRQMADLGFHMQYYKNCGRFGKTNRFEDHAFVFTKKLGSISH